MTNTTITDVLDQFTTFVNGARTIHEEEAILYWVSSIGQTVDLLYGLRINQFTGTMYPLQNNSLAVVTIVNTSNISVSNIKNPGVYFLTIQSKESKVVKKIVIQ